jgi:hypothetical protein
MKSTIYKITATFLGALIVAGAQVPTPALADWDHAAKAREAAARKKAAAEAAKRAAEDKKASANTTRKMLAAKPYGEDPAKLAAMSDDDVFALLKRRASELASNEAARQQKMISDVAKAMSSLTPEQRAMMERMSGQNIDQAMKDAQKAAKK